MKQNISKWLLSSLLLTTLALGSCVKDEPVKPTLPKPDPKPTPEQPVDPKKDEPEVSKPKVTFRPHRIKLNLYEGHLHNVKDFHYVAGPSKVKYAKLEQSLSYTWDPTSSSYTLDKESRQRLIVQQGKSYKADGQESAPAPVYGLWIEYFNEQGQMINAEIGDKGAYDLYQHFFIAEAAKPAFMGDAEADDNDPSKLMGYIYRDTDPWDKSIKEGGRVIEETSPLGLKGFFTFYKTRKTFDMKIQLWQVPEGAKTKEGIAPYHTPSAAFKNKGVQVLELTVPVLIYRSRDDMAFPSTDSDSFDDFDKDEQDIIDLFAKAFDITREQVIYDLYWMIEGKGEGESDGRWF